MQVRAAQIRLGDREVTVNAAGERVSRLREVDADWILRRLERWGRRVRAASPRRRPGARRACGGRPRAGCGGPPCPIAAECGQEAVYGNSRVPRRRSAPRTTHHPPMR